MQHLGGDAQPGIDFKTASDSTRSSKIIIMCAHKKIVWTNNLCDKPEMGVIPTIVGRGPDLFCKCASDHVVCRRA